MKEQRRWRDRVNLILGVPPIFSAKCHAGAPALAAGDREPGKIGVLTGVIRTASGGFTMTMEELQAKAKELGVDHSPHASKPTLVRAIQRRLGHPACFATDERYACTKYACEWRADCLKPVAEWLR